MSTNTKLYKKRRYQKKVVKTVVVQEKEEDVIVPVRADQGSERSGDVVKSDVKSKGGSTGKKSRYKLKRRPTPNITIGGNGDEGVEMKVGECCDDIGAVEVSTLVEREVESDVDVRDVESAGTVFFNKENVFEFDSASYDPESEPYSPNRNIDKRTSGVKDRVSNRSNYYSPSSSNNSGWRNDNYSPSRRNDNYSPSRRNDNYSPSRRNNNSPQRGIGKKKKNFILDEDVDLKLSDEILSLYNTLIPDKDEQDMRTTLFASLKETIENHFQKNKAVLHMYGSSTNGLAMKKADLDVCLILELGDSSVSEIILQLDLLANNIGMEQIYPLPWARVPIIKFVDPSTQISCDICINNPLAIINSNLLRDYVNLDPRVRQLGIIIKYWAKRRKLNNTYSGSLSSYAYILLIINFLQRRKPSVVPCLQKMRKSNSESVIVDGFDCYYFNDMESLNDYSKKNTESIGSLLVNFFRFYFHFNYKKNVISIRTGCYISKEEKGWSEDTEDPITQNYLTLEDPFEVTHNLGRNSEKTDIEDIRSEFRRGFDCAQKGIPLGVICKKIIVDT